MSGWYWISGWLPSLLAVVGNGLVIYMILTIPRLRTTHNRFVLSLAIADFCVGICFYPGHVICHFLLPSCNELIRDDVSVLMIYASVSNLCAMSLDRYIAIVKPLHYMSLMTFRRATILTALAWIIPFSTYFIPAICTSFALFSINFKVSVIIWTTMFEFVPCVGLLVATTHAVITSRKHYRRDAHLNSQIRYNQPNIKLHRSFHSATLIATVVGIFLACYAVEIYSSFCHFTELCTMNKNLYNVVRFLVIVNSAANPLAYAFLKKDIRKELHKKLCHHSFDRRRAESNYTVRTTSV